MTEPLVLRDDRDGIATLTLNRPAKLNALTLGSFTALRDHLDTLEDDEGVRCVVLAGTGRSFCAGHDLASIASAEEADERFAAETIDALETLRVPTIAAIHGHCLTGGLELALGCDILVAADDAQLGDTHGRWGLMPVWGMSVRLPERVGPGRAKELMFTSRLIDGAEAERIGLVDRCVRAAELMDAVARLAAEIAANSTGTNRIDKALLAAGARMTRDEALRFERSEPFGRPADMAERLATGRGG